MSENQDTPLRNPILESEIADLLRRHAFSELEKIPEIRELMAATIRERIESARLAESFSLLPASELHGLMQTYFEEMFEVMLHTFFDRLYNGLLGILRQTFSARLEVMEEAILDLKRSVLMASLHPHAWVEGEILQASMEYAESQPGQKVTVDSLYRYLIYETNIPLPGVERVQKVRYLVSVLRRAKDVFVEIEGFLFELLKHDVREERETLASSQSKRTTSRILASLRSMDQGDDQDPGKVQGVPEET